MRLTIKFICTTLILFYYCRPKEIPVEVIDIESYSSYTGSEIDSFPSFEAKNVAYDSLIGSVLDDIGFSNSDIQIRTINQFGAFAIISKNCKQRILAYNEKFFDSLLNQSNSIQAVKSVCYHEVAHHFYRHPLKSKWESKIHELEADRYSGFQMRLIGASIEESIVAMEIFGDETPTFTHPDKWTRINEIKAGYYDAGERYCNDEIEVVNDSLFIHQILFKDNRKLEKNSSDNKFFELAMEIPNITNDAVNSSLSNIDEALPIYGFLGQLIMITESNAVIDVETNNVVGKYVTPYPDANFGLLKFETSIYRVENNDIYSITPSGAKIKLGSKIN